MIPPITLRKPIMPVAPPVTSGRVLIRKHAHSGYRVDKAHVKQGSTLEWKGDGFIPDEIIVFFPHGGGIIIRDFPVTFDGEVGVYQYGLFIRIGDVYYAVEGNSPPEMIIE